MPSSNFLRFRMGQRASVFDREEAGEEEEEDEEEDSAKKAEDLTLQFPEECLSSIFQKLCSTDRNACSLVCKRWLVVEAQGRHRLTLVARMELLSALPSLLSRFVHITKLALKCERKALSINDKALLLVGQHCSELKKVKLKGCKQLTDEGLDKFSKVCGPLKKISCASCSFGARGLNSILLHCSFLEDLTIKRLRGLAEGPPELIGPGCAKIRRLCLKKLYNAQVFAPLIAGSKNLEYLILCKISGNWDKLLEIITEHVPNLVELHMEKLHLSDRGLQAVSKCSNLAALYVVKAPECSNYGLTVIAEGCRKLRRLHVDEWKFTHIGDDGLASVAWKCRDLQELVLIGVNVGAPSLGLIASNCLELERLALCNCENVEDLTLSCISDKCHSLKRLCIKNCPITNQGIRAFANGCPNLVKIKLKKCRGVTADTTTFFRDYRPSLVISLDCEVPVVEPDRGRMAEESIQVVRTPTPTSQVRSTLAKFRHALVDGGSFVACTLLKFSSPNDLK